jgi:hypothetical protein
MGLALVSRPPPSPSPCGPLFSSYLLDQGVFLSLSFQIIWSAQLLALSFQL